MRRSVFLLPVLSIACASPPRQPDPSPVLRFATFQFPEDGAPLSWKMNGRQIDAIENKWNNILAAAASSSLEGDDLLQVKCLFVGAAVSPRCGDVARKDPW